MSVAQLRGEVRDAGLAEGAGRDDHLRRLVPVGAGTDDEAAAIGRLEAVDMHAGAHRQLHAIRVALQVVGDLVLGRRARGPARGTACPAARCCGRG